MIPLIQSTFYNEKKTLNQLASFIKSSHYLSFGKQCQSFEKQFAKWQGRKYGVLVNSGSSANLAIIQSLLNLHLLKRGDAVGFSAITWSTNVMPLIQLGLQPVPIDIELDTLNISSQNLQHTLKTSKIKALFITNLLGFCDDIDRIAQICQDNKILLIEDNCESLGSIYKGKKLGNYGLASTVSFYVGHHMSTIEGGAVVTDNSALAEMLNLVRAHGWDRNLSFAKQEKLRKRFEVNSTFYSRYTFYDLGYNLRPTEITGFLGKLQLTYLDQIIKKRQDNFLYFAKYLYTNERYYPLRYAHMDLVSNFAVPLICTSKKIREHIVKNCDGKVEIRPIVGGNMVSQPFMKKYTDLKELCPNATIIHDQGLYFGNNPDLTRKNMTRLKDLFLS